jgi:penicillin amidase
MNLPRWIMQTVFGRRLPITSGEIRLPGIGHPVVIRRDRYGIPYIQAETEVDAWYGLGFCHGQDRAFQLEILRRTSRGTMAELIGPQGLQMDRLSRRFGFHHYAKQQMGALDADIHQTLKAFADGVTHGTSVGCKQQAHEFTFLRGTPTPFQAVDVVASQMYLAFALSLWSAKLTRLILLREDGPEALTSLSESYAAWNPVTHPVGVLPGKDLDQLGEDLARLVEVMGLSGASNNWVLDSSRTATGRPLLANDPHLSPSLPAPWYLASVRTPDWAAAGASFIGSPSIISGHNGFAAWGVTAGLADNLDLYLEELGEGGRSVRQGDQFVPCEVREEEIKVKGEAPVIEEVMVTPRGPIISPALEGDPGAISIRATWMSPKSLRGFLVTHRSKSFDEFRRAFEDWSAVSLNVVYADTSDTIGWQLIGDIPQRKEGWGTMPLPGWQGNYDWEPDSVPFHDMPHARSPETGFIATANNKPTVDGDGPYLGADWADGYRLARIVEVLGDRRDWDINSSQSLQLDKVAIPWREIREVVLSTPVETTEAKQALGLLRDWDGVVTEDSPAASVYEFFLAEMAQKITRAKAPKAFDWAMSRGFNPLADRSHFGSGRVSQIVELLREQPQGWFQRPWEEGIAEVLTLSIRKLKGLFGPSTDQWAWGRVRPLTLTHPLSVRPPLDRIFNLGPFPWGGDGQTVAQAGRSLADPTINPTTVANLRMVVDVGNWEENRFVLAGGQSGNPLSPHYADLLSLWKRGEGVPIAWSEEKIDQGTVATLRLTPT